eukprot:TRINITY_DN2722_c0_g5_i1.p1 TRINITY_DN2722_c0_g5~~TRINITY_DN2722_c0_g5_i1.p1  ORF type:complete len:417 (+),score=75.22 TRINITY_DN2722_c0_g5_i1:257-1507(+)
MPRGAAASSATRAAKALRAETVVAQRATPSRAVESSIESVVDGSVHPRRLVAPWTPFGEALRQHWACLQAGGNEVRSTDCSKVTSDVAVAGATSLTRPPTCLKFWSNLRPLEPSVLDTGFFFRLPADMPPIERRALELCRQLGGRVLDIGAGAGTHALALEGFGLAAEAIDVDPAAVEVMQFRGVRARQCSLWELKDLHDIDTILLLMNSVGVVGSMKRLKEFLTLLHTKTRPGCTVVLDVSPPDWVAVHSAAQRRKEPLTSNCFQSREWAVLTCWVSFGDLQGKAFPLLFTEPWSAASAAAAAGWRADLVAEDVETRHALLRLERLDGVPQPVAVATAVKGFGDGKKMSKGSWKGDGKVSGKSVGKGTWKGGKSGDSTSGATLGDVSVAGGASGRGGKGHGSVGLGGRGHGRGIE